MLCRKLTGDTPRGNRYRNAVTKLICRFAAGKKTLNWLTGLIQNASLCISR